MPVAAPEYTFDQIDPSLGAEIAGGGAGQRYPSIQASCYQPKITDKLDLVLGEKSLALLSDKAKAMLISGTIETAFSDDSEVQTVSVVNPAIRWIFIGMPTARFVRNKDTKKVLPLKEGMNFKRDRLESFTKIYLAAILDEELIKNDNGEIQVFSLSLNSTKTILVENDRDPEYRSVRKLNNWIAKQSKGKLDPSKFWVHLASVSLIVKPEKLVGADGKASIGAMYVINDLPRVLAPNVRQEMSLLASSPEMKILVPDPFLLNEKNREAISRLQEASGSSALADGEGSTNPDDEF